MAKPPKYIWTSGGVGIRDKKSPSGYREVSPQEFIEDIMCCGFCDCRTGNKVGVGDFVNAPCPTVPIIKTVISGQNPSEDVTSEIPPKECEIKNILFSANGVIQTEGTDFTTAVNPDGSVTVTTSGPWGSPGDPCTLALYYDICC